MFPHFRNPPPNFAQFHLDDIRSSYLLMAVCVGVLMITAIGLLVQLQRERDPEEAQVTPRM